MAAPPAKRQDTKAFGTLNYFPLRGRGEPIRLILAANNLEWEEISEFNRVEGVAGTGELPFGQLPTWSQDNLGGRPLSQMDAICRHIGRQVGWYGAGAKDMRVDEILAGVEDLRQQYLKLVYRSKFDKDALVQYEQEVLSRSGMLASFNLRFLENCLEREAGGQWAVGDSLTIADSALFDIFNAHVDLQRNQAQHITLEPLVEFPLLAAHHAKFAALPGVAKYCKERRFAKVNGTEHW